MLVERRPHPALRRHIRSYYGFTEETPRAAASAGGPGSSVVLVISFERLAEAGDWKTRFDLLEAALGARVADGRPFSDGAAWAWPRLLRLERAIELARLGAAWAEDAYACGYYDQSHLANEFRRITGASPTQYLAP